MQIVAPFSHWLATFLFLPALLPAATPIQVREPENEGETPPTMSPQTIVATEPPDNGMAVGEAPTEVTSGTLGTPLFRVDDTAEFTTPKPIIDAVFPENHKINFTGSPYLGTIETPPLLNTFNKYQNSYKQYYAQKNEFANSKPIKFEENYGKNSHIPNAGLSAYAEESQAGSDLHSTHRPFPYAYDPLQGHEPPQAHYAPQNHEEDIKATEDANGLEGLLGDTPEVTPGYNFFSSAASPLTNLFPFARGHHHHKPKTEVFPDEGKHRSSGTWKKTLRFLSTVIPFGLFLATLTPNILQINTVEDNRPSRLRSLEGADTTDPLVALVQRFGGLEAMEDSTCEDRFFCEMSVLGKNETSNFVEKGFWLLANETPDDMAEEAGMKDLFNAIRANNCEVYDCRPKESQLEGKQSQDSQSQDIQSHEKQSQESQSHEKQSDQTQPKLQETQSQSKGQLQVPLKIEKEAKPKKFKKFYRS